jgi:hypothetical protein
MKLGFSTELIGIPYLEELSKLPHLDPLFSDKKWIWKLVTITI